MNFLIDQNLPVAKELFSAHGELHFFSGRELPSELLAKTEVLLIRSVTQITESVLAKAKNLKFVGTATIGMDHLDSNALTTRGITFANAAGCNAAAVGEYVLSGVLAVAGRHQFSLAGKRALIVGAGNTGSEAGRRLSALGMHVSYIDPIKKNMGENFVFGDWRDLASFDVISCHVPMQLDGEHATWHLLDAVRINALKPGCILINASRGAVLDNVALQQRLQKFRDIHVVLDVWEGEPTVLPDLVPLVEIATPHIAGHSIEGKIRGTYRLYQQLHEYFAWTSALVSERSVLPKVRDGVIHLTNEFSESDIALWVDSVYSINQDDTDFRQNGLTPEGFDKLRKEYPLRRELWSQVLQCVPLNSANQCQQLEALGFSVRSA